jgi:hypothetical protein
MTMRDERPPKIVELECGCEYVAHHHIGDRLFICKHVRKWTISAVTPREVYYEVNEIKPQPSAIEIRNKEIFE